MKFNYIITVVVAALLFSCSGRDKTNTRVETNMLQDSLATTTVMLIDSIHDFGTVTEGEMVEFSFRFKNSGKKPLIVSNVNASCGCTVPEKPEEPVMPGEMGYIKVKFNSDRRPGQTSKSVNVVANTVPAFPDLLLKGIVLEKKNK